MPSRPPSLGDIKHGVSGNFRRIGTSSIHKSTKGPDVPTTTRPLSTALAYVPTPTLPTSPTTITGPTITRSRRSLPSAAKGKRDMAWRLLTQGLPGRPFGVAASASHVLSLAQSTMGQQDGMPPYSNKVSITTAVSTSSIS